MWCVETGFNVNRSSQGAHLRVTGKALVEDPERTKDPVDFVQRLLAEKDKYDRCVMAKGFFFKGVAYLWQHLRLASGASCPCDNPVSSCWHGSCCSRRGSFCYRHRYESVMPPLSNYACVEVH